MTDPVKFLFVDDLEENLLALEALLASEGLDLHKAQSGEEALELMLANEYALALLDVQMPGMDGFELAEFMRANERSRHIPIIFVTAGSGDEARRFRGYEAGAVDFIQKPIEADVLRSKANVFLDLYNQRRQITAQRDELAKLTAALQAANQQKNRFLAVLAHELRNPLAVFSSGLNILDRGNSGRDLSQVRLSMRQNLNHVTRLVDDLLDINRIERGKILLRKQKVGLDEVLPAALELAEPAIVAANHRLTVETPDDAITLEVDPARFIQIISNIVGNFNQWQLIGWRVLRVMCFAAGIFCAHQVKVILTMASGAVHEPCPRIIGHEIPFEKRHTDIVIIIFMRIRKRVLSDRTFKLRALHSTEKFPVCDKRLFLYAVSKTCSDCDLCANLNLRIFGDRFDFVNAIFQISTIRDSAV